METSYGQYISNKTYKFIAPLLKGHGKNFTERLNNKIFKMAYAMHDSNLADQSIISGTRPIFVMCDRAYMTDDFHNFLSYVREKEAYITDYPFEYNQQGPSRRHVIVFNIPEKFSQCYDKFKTGEYSKMFLGIENEIDNVYADGSYASMVIRKDSKAESLALRKLREEFNVELPNDYFKQNPNLEFEIPYFTNIEEETL